MNRKILLLLLSISVCLVFAEASEYVPTQYNQAFAITAKAADHMDITFTLPEFTLEEAIEGESVYQRVLMPDAGTTLDSGYPELPTISISLAIPRQGSFQIQALNTQQSLLPQFLPYPVQQGQELDSPKGFVLNTDYYTSGSSYPAAAIEYSDPAILRDFRIVTVQINPFSYNPLTQALTVRQSINFRVTYTSEPGINELEGELTSISLAFSNIYESMIFNFADYRDRLVASTPPRILIIHGNNTDPNFLTAINNFALWKRQKGADVTVANTSSSSAGSSTTSIKNFIQAAYNNPLTRPDFVILIGDTSGSYTIPTYTVSGGEGDYPYTHLAGSDGLGDAFIGRICVENLSQLQTMLAKVYLYERDINLSTAQWLNRMLLVGDPAHSGISTMYTNKYIKEMALYVNPDYTFTELYSSNPSTATMNAAINQGVGYFSYRGYIGMSGWSPSESSLNNAYRLLHAIIITCSTGDFDGGTDTTEQFTRLGTAASPKGAVTAMGMATSSTHTVFNNALHGGVWGGLLQYNMRTPGEAMLNGKLYIAQIFGQSSPSNATSFAHWLNLMGDPSMEMYTGIPNNFTITTQDSIPLGLSLLDVAVRDSLNMPVAGASVTLTQSGTIISRGFSDIQGNVILQLPQGMAGTGCIITVSKHDFKPLQQAIAVYNTGTLVPGTVTIDDDNLGASNGNGDGLITAGETVELLFGLTNTGVDPIAGITGYVATDSPYVTFIDSLVTYSTIAGTAQGFSASPVVMHISPDAPHETMLRIHLILNDSLSVSYNVSEFVPVHNARMIFNSYLVTNGGNQVLDPGETSGFTITVSNTASTGVTDIYGRLYSLNDLVAVTDNTAYYGDMLQNVLVTPAADTFTLLGRSMLLPGMIIPMQLKLYNAAGYLQWIDFTLTVGVVTITDPLGPDAYGYVIYDDQDTSYENCPVYDWVGIAPAEGGTGTALAISDAYTSSDEGDQVGADALEVVNLPFPFQFYGILYNQITVCSNGFVALGVSANAEFRNYRIPGPMGPNPMIAPFWDDLATHSGGGIYTWYDRNNQAFVIEWYNLKNGFNGTSPETFQIILYDQAFHSSSLGDGPIKIQYQTFNNVSASAGSGNHGCFATIGIEDHSGLVGLEYTFNNQYPTAARPLANQRAIYITNIPIYHEAAYLILGETFIDDNNGNQVCEPSETIELGVQLQNIGNTTSEEVSVTLSTLDPYITLVGSVATYFPIAGETFGVNRTPLIFAISPDCPNGHVVHFSLQIVSGESVWTRIFSIRVDASILVYSSFMINDADANFNGIIDPLEAVQLIVNLNNHSDVEARDIVATLSTTNPDVLISQPTVNLPMIEANAIMQLVYDLQFTGTQSEGSYIPFQFNASILNGLPLDATISVPYNMENVFNDFETTNGNFNSEAGWTWGTPNQVTPYSGTKLWATSLSGNYPDYANFQLVTPVYALEAGSVLTFKHRYGFQANYDGGNISISTNDGGLWMSLTPQGGYPYASLAGLGGEPGFSGSLSTWGTVTIDLSQYAGQQVRFRFRMGSNSTTSGIGWFIDNFELSAVNQKTGYIHGTVIPVSETPVTEVLVKANNYLATHPKDNGTYRLYLPNGTFTVTASLQYHQSSSVSYVHVNPETPVHLADFTLIHLPKPEGASFAVNNATGTVSLTWNQPYDPVLPVAGYRVYKKFDTGPFTLILQTTDTSHSDQINLQGNYKYYICALFGNTEGSPSDTLAFAYPYVSDGDIVTPPQVTKLYANFPNPFNPSTAISFDLAQSGKVKLSIYNLKGQLVNTLADTDLASGQHTLIWNGRDKHERSVASGVYFFRLETRDYKSTRKMLLVK